MSKFRTRKFKPRKEPLTGERRITIWLVICVVGIGFLLWFVNKAITPPLFTYAEVQTNRVATLIINKAVEERVKDGINVNQLITTKTDDKGKVSTINFNITTVNALRSSMTQSIQEALQNAEKGDFVSLGLSDELRVKDKGKQLDGVIDEIPLGRVTNNAFLANVGPKIPVRFTSVGDVKTDVVQKATPYGINNSLVEISMNVEVNLQVMIPFNSEVTKVKAVIPIATQIIQGDVPSYYNGGNNDTLSPTSPDTKKP